MEEKPAQISSSRNNEVPLLDYLIVVAKNGRLILKVTVIVTVLTYLILLLFVPKKYTAVAAILPPQQNLTLSGQLLESLGGGTTPGAPVGAMGGLGGMTAGLLGLKSPGDLYVGMLTGNTIFDRIIERFNLRKLYNEEYIEVVRKTLARYTDITTDKKSGLINIQVTDTSPQQAAEMANAFVEELDQLLRKMVVTEAEGRLAFLEKERLKVNHNLIEAEKTLKNFMEQNNVIQIDVQAKGMLEYIAQLRAQVDAKEVQIKVARQAATIFNPDISRLETELLGIKEKLKLAETQFDPNCVGDVCLAATKVPALGLEYLRLYRETKFQEALLQLYNKMTELARLDMVRNVSVIQVVDQPTLPEKKSNPRLPPTILAGSLTFIIMVFVAFFKEHYRKVQRQGEVTQRLEILAQHCQPLVSGWDRLRGLIKSKKWPRERWPRK
jgi:capsule polysaccharide export protein KpsE/RkpR